jgi:cardiolipin synthase
VDVRLIVPHIPDKRRVFELTRAHYVPLVEAGVKVYEYLPGFIHSKTIVADDKYGVVGTINLDYRSLYHHFECAVWMHGVSCIGQIKADFLETQSFCREIGEESIRQEKWITRLLGAVMKVIAPLM